MLLIDDVIVRRSLFLDILFFKETLFVIFINLTDGISIPSVNFCCSAIYKRNRVIITKLQLHGPVFELETTKKSFANYFLYFCMHIVFSEFIIKSILYIYI